MTFWNWRRGGGTATSGAAALANGTDLAPIELYTGDTRVVGWIASKGQRVTDLLLASEELRLHRRIQRVAADAGPFTVTGNLHLPPGAPFPDPFQLPAFIPLTEAHLLHHGDPAFEHVVSVVIVNATHVTRLVPLVSLA